MTKLFQHLADMRLRLNEIASDEQALVKALGEALNRVDEQLLRDVRTLASAHEARREVILKELQGLASSFGMFPAPRQAVTNGEPTYMPAQPQQALGGDWRQAANNIGDDFDVDMDWRAPPH